MTEILTLPNVTAIETDNGTVTRIDPPLDTLSGDGRKLAWHAAVVSLNTSLPIEVWRHGKSPTNRHVTYTVRVAGGSSGPYEYFDAWIFLNGVETGVAAIVRQVRAQIEQAQAEQT